MQKKDFIQSASIEFMPQLEWDVDKSIGYAERLWQRLCDKGYGTPKPNGPQEIHKAYNKLTPLMKTAFDLFWLAFDYKQGKDEAAASWLKLGDLSKAECDQIIAGAKCTASARKTQPKTYVPIMAQGWLNKRRWLDQAETVIDAAQKQVKEQRQAEQEIRQNLAHAKRMVEQTGREQTWLNEVEKLTEKLRLHRDAGITKP